MGNIVNTVLVSKDKMLIELLSDYLKGIEKINESGSFTSLNEAHKYISIRNISILILDVSEYSEEIFMRLTKLTKTKKNLKVIVISKNTETSFVVKMMEAGVREFVLQPVLKSNFQKIVEKMRDLSIGTILDNSKCKVITTFSNKGGIGKTVTAVNLALELANLTKEDVALVDFNVQLGDVATFLDLNPHFDISYVLDNLNIADKTFLTSTLERYQDTNLYVLADTPYIERDKKLSAEQITNLIDKFRQSFSYVIIDTHAAFDENNIAVLDNTDFILLLSIVNLPAIRNCQRCLNIFQKLGYSKDRIGIILNRYMDNEEIPIKDIENVLSKEIYWKIPNNYFTVMSSINKGIPISILNSESNISKNYKELAGMISDSGFNVKLTYKIDRGKDFNILNFFKNIKY